MILVGFAILMFGMDTMSSAVKTACRCSGIYEYPADVLESGSGCCRRGSSDGGHSELVGIDRYSAGIVCDWFGDIRCGASYYHGTEYRHLRDSDDFRYWSKQNARRAALVHLYFNIIGTVIFMVAFYVLNAAIGFAFLGDAANPAGIAVIHSIFNISATAVLLPFSKGLEKLALPLTIKADEETELPAEETADLQFLDARFLDQPAFAIGQCARRLPFIWLKWHRRAFTRR